PVFPPHSPFRFEYRDRDCLEAEINEFYNYQDSPFIQEGCDLFEAEHGLAWRSGDSQVQDSIVASLLGQLELKDPEQRYSAAKCLLYVAQGCFHDLPSKAEHLRSIRRNNMLLLRLGALDQYRFALQVVSRTLDLIARLAAADEQQQQQQQQHHQSHLQQQQQLDALSFSQLERQAAMDLANAEISTYLSLCYMLVEVNLEDPVLRADLAAGDVPFAAFLFELVDQLGEGNRKHYPVKK
ncbi:Factor arrest protein 11, partial [Cladochytrium tenue]